MSREKRFIVCPQGSTPTNPVALYGAEDVAIRHQSGNRKLILDTADRNNVAVILYSHEAADDYRKSKEAIEVEGKQYHVQKLLGEGAFGDCYLVVDRNLKCYAIKKIKRARFREDEERILRLLNGFPYTINLLGVQSDPQQEHVVLLMEYAKGGNLKDFLPSKKLRERDKLKVVEDLMLAVRYIHSQSIVHADIKPENILMIVQNGELHRAVLADFGLSLCTNGKDYPPTKAWGTPRYRSPELCRPNSFNTYASDMWACGCVVVEICTGDALWEDVAPRDVIPTIRNLTESPVPRNMPEPFLNLSRAILALEPQDRSSATDICSMLGFNF